MPTILYTTSDVFLPTETEGHDFQWQQILNVVGNVDETFGAPARIRTADLSLTRGSFTPRLETYKNLQLSRDSLSEKAIALPAELQGQILNSR